MRSFVLSTLLLSLLAAAPAAAQSANYGLLGSPCTGGRLDPGAGPVPLIPIGLPQLGSVFQIETESSGRGITGIGRQVFLFTGLSDTSFGGIPLPLDLSILFPTANVCGALQTSIELQQSVPSTGNPAINARLSFPIPRDPSLRGLLFFQQVLSLESSTFGPPFLGVAVSALAIGTVGT
ncbi:MAG: hypothetical protein JNM84_13665 [Planctomycetes bacterium]|nr:hypothetical protein [Planctomycetota bacterium]